MDQANHEDNDKSLGIIDIQAEKEKIIKIYDESIHKKTSKKNIGG